MPKVIKQRSITTYNAEKHGTIAGRVLLSTTFVPKDRKPGDPETRRVMLVDADSVCFRVYESAGLVEMFETAEVGDFVSITDEGMVETKNKRRMRKFTTSVWTDSDAGPCPAPPKDPFGGDHAKAEEANGAKSKKRGR